VVWCGVQNANEVFVLGWHELGKGCDTGYLCVPALLLALQRIEGAAA
jgi:hypothetical protein